MYKTGNANVDLRSPGETMIEPAGELRLLETDLLIELIVGLLRQGEVARRVER